jgi:malonyl-CoA O-methyltransferase
VWRLDHCPELLAEERLQQGPAPQLTWDLNKGLPPELQGASLLASNFALQWLEEPAAKLQQWCAQLRPGGWLALAVPTNGSFAAWRQAAAQANVPFTGLALPSATALEQVGRQQLQLRLCRRLCFSRSSDDPTSLLHQIRATGAQASRHRPLRPGELRRLLLHWPNTGACPLEWEVLLLLGQKA